MLKNTTKKTIISRQIKFCNSLFLKATGLMFSKKKDRALVFDFKKEKIVSLHMLFVFYPIDVMFLNKDKKVVELKENFKPFMFYTPKKKARYVVEVLEGIVKSSRTKINDRIHFNDNL